METEYLDKRQRLYDSIAQVKDDYTRRVLYSQFIDSEYKEAFEAILEEFKLGRVQRVDKPEVI